MDNYKDTQTVIVEDGLRYTTKQAGYPFQGMGRTGETMSCMKCGLHKLRSKGSFKHANAQRETTTESLSPAPTHWK
jgi:hypothetical protein